jgi:E3 ubiquitin-protein ligase HUWE1
MSAASVMMGSGLAQQSSSASVVDQPRAPGSLRVLLRHRKLLNAYIRQTPALLDNAFKLIRDSYPRMLDFDNKRVYFNNRLRRENKDMRRGQLTLRVKRSDVFTQSFQQLDYYEPQELKGRLMVQFEGEEAIDAGGVSREWFLILSREIFDLKYGLFVKSAEHVTYQPNFQLRKTSEYEISLKYFKFIGRVFGKAIYDAQLLDAHFTRSFYKHMLGVPVSVQDMAAFDPSYHQSLSWILENKVADLGMDLTFTIEEETFGVTETIELKEGGKDIAVTDENKKEYVQLVVEQKLCKSIQPQIDQFLKGFHEVIPDYINIFNEQELELLISGLPDIDIDDLKRNTEYVGYTATSPVITNFWRAVESFTREELANLVQFCTGTAKVPLEGFVALEGMNGPQKFQIHKAYGDLDRLATAHTCFNQLDLPEYASYDQMVEKLKMAFMEANQGFGFV